MNQSISSPVRRHAALDTIQARYDCTGCEAVADLVSLVYGNVEVGAELVMVQSILGTSQFTFVPWTLLLLHGPSESVSFDLDSTLYTPMYLAMMSYFFAQANLYLEYRNHTFTPFPRIRTLRQVQAGNSCMVHRFRWIFVYSTSTRVLRNPGWTFSHPISRVLSVKSVPVVNALAQALPPSLALQRQHH